jgi:drug/metabolite transporter (DMT)-like permease
VAHISRRSVGIAAAFAAIYLIWGSTYLAVALALGSLPPFFLMGSRSVGGGLVLLLWTALRGEPLGSLTTWGSATLCGLFFFVGCHGVLAYAQQHAPSGLAAVLLATIPFWIVGLKMAIPGDARPPVSTLLLLLPGLAGVGLIAWRQLADSSGARLTDILLLLGASASWALGTILSKRYPGSASPVALSGMELVTGGVALLALSFAFGEPSRLDISNISLPSLAGWAYLTFVGTVVGFAAYVWLLKQVSSTLVSTYTFINPIIAVLLGWLVLGEQPSGWMIAGAVLVIASVVGVLMSNPDAKKETWMSASATIASMNSETIKIGVGAPLSGNSAELGREIV